MYVRMYVCVCMYVRKQYLRTYVCMYVCTCAFVQVSIPIQCMPSLLDTAVPKSAVKRGSQLLDCLSSSSALVLEEITKICYKGTDIFKNVIYYYIKLF
jgi:hypothetical protein